MKDKNIKIIIKNIKGLIRDGMVSIDIVWEGYTIQYDMDDGNKLMIKKNEEIVFFGKIPSLSWRRILKRER